MLCLVLSHVWIECQISICRNVRLPVKSEMLVEMKYPKFRKNLVFSSEPFYRFTRIKFTYGILICFCKFLKSQEILIGLHGTVHALGITEVDPVGTPLQELYIFIDGKGILMFFASTFWRKLQNIFGECCISKLAKVAKPWLAGFRPALSIADII